MHEALQSGLKDDVDDIQRNGAIQTQQGWMHINGLFQAALRCTLRLIATTDDRNIPALGRIADPDDILASVRVEEGKVRLRLQLRHTTTSAPAHSCC